jgi:hypothetical protein
VMADGIDDTLLPATPIFSGRGGPETAILR